MRAARGWRITTAEIDENSVLIEGKKTEILVLLVLTITTWCLCALNHSSTNESFPILFASASSVGLFLIMPFTWLVMRTRWPLLIGLFLIAGVPMLTLISLIGIEFPNYVLSGILVSPFTRLVFIDVFVVMLVLVAFFFGLRLVGYRLITPRNWQRKRMPTEPKPHPLDD